MKHDPKTIKSRIAEGYASWVGAKLTTPYAIIMDAEDVRNMVMGSDSIPMFDPEELPWKVLGMVLLPAGKYCEITFCDKLDAIVKLAEINERPR